jgi:23S rRNA pseudouridine2605 synthase
LSGPRRRAPARGPRATAGRAGGARGEVNRLQKVLAEAGVASRRQIEAWVRAGRILVNGKPAQPGQPVGSRDTILIDGRRIRLDATRADKRLTIVYHRPPGEPLSPAVAVPEAATVPTSVDRLPAVRGHRWLPLSPLAPIDSGLEIFTTDGALRAAAGRAAHSLESRYAVRLRGEFAPEFLASLPGLARAAEPPFEILAAEAGGGEGHNVWLNLTVKGARGRDLRALFAQAGFEVSRLMRTHYGPLGMDRALARGRHRELDDEERTALLEALGVAESRPGRPPEGRAARRTARATPRPARPSR